MPPYEKKNKHNFYFTDGDGTVSKKSEPNFRTGGSIKKNKPIFHRKQAKYRISTVKGPNRITASNKEHVKENLSK